MTTLPSAISFTGPTVTEAQFKTALTDLVTVVGEKADTAAQQTALNLKAPIANPTFTGTVAGVTATMVGLGNVNNTSDLNKPVSTATATAIAAASGAVSSVAGRTGAVTLTKTDVGLASVDNTADAAKPVSTAQQTALNLKANLASPTFTGTVGLPNASYAISVTGSSASCTGNSGTASTLAGDQSNWASYRGSAVANMLGWKNFQNGHVIFDASASTSPTGSAVNNANALSPWSASYPTLMGWNGSQTYGVRVDSARVADSCTGNAASATTCVGVGQTWQNLQASRAINTTYTNSTGKPIMVVIAMRDYRDSQNGGGTAYVDGVLAARSGGYSDAYTITTSMSFIVPNGSTYIVYPVEGNYDVNNMWSELR